MGSFVSPVVRVCLGLLLTMPLLSSCAGLNLYDAERDKVAQAAKKSFESANVQGTVAAVRQNMAELSDAETAQTRRLVELRRDLLLSAIAGDAPCDPTAERDAAPRFYDTYVACIDRELQRLVGEVPAKNPAALRTQFRIAVVQMQSSLEALADDRTKFQLVFKGVGPPPCNPNQAPSLEPPEELQVAINKAAPQAVELPGQYKEFRANCEEYRTALTTIGRAGAEDSVFGKSVAGWVAGQKALSEARSNAASLKHTYDKAVDEYNTAAAKLPTGPSQAARDEANKLLDNVRGAAKSLEDVAALLGVKALSEDRLTQLDTVIGALQGGTLDPKTYGADTRRALSALSALPAFADSALDLASQQQAPPLASLILAKELQQVRLAAADRQAMRAEQRLSLLEQRMNGYRDEIMAILEARQRLALASGGAPGGLTSSAVEAFSTAVPANARVQLLRSVTAFADSFSLGGAAAADADYRLVALEYDKSLDRSEDAVKEWERLIAVPIDRLIAFYGSGIKAETVAAIMTQALGLGLIGAGVNR